MWGILWQTSAWQLEKSYCGNSCVLCTAHTPKYLRPPRGQFTACNAVRKFSAPWDTSMMDYLCMFQIREGMHSSITYRIPWCNAERPFSAAFLQLIAARDPINSPLQLKRLHFLPSQCTDSTAVSSYIISWFKGNDLIFPGWNPGPPTAISGSVYLPRGRILRNTPVTYPLKAFICWSVL